MIGVFIQVNTESQRGESDPIGYVVCESGCWEWVGHLMANGYGQLRVSGRGQLAHRFLFEMIRGPIPEGLQLDHLCRNRKCVRPEHLEPVTQQVNILRGEGLSVRHANQATCREGHPLNGENLYRHPSGSRACRTCRVQARKAYYWLHKKRTA